MAALSNFVPGVDSLARARSGLLTAVIVCAAAAGNSCAGTGSSGSGGDSAPIKSGSAEARAFVDAHNAVRAAVKKPARYAGTWTPLPPVSWSDEVAGTAQAWADNLRDTMDCGLRHDSGTRYGENLAAGRNLDAAGAVAMWAGEIDHYRYAPKYVFETDSGHYTQLVWRTSTRIGCGRARCGGDAVVACRYSPPGNAIGRAPY